MDWGMIELKLASNGEREEDLHVAQDVVLESLVKAVMGEVQEGNLGVFAKGDLESDGYYVVRCKSVP
jgi:hypothetical protein